MNHVHPFEIQKKHLWYQFKKISGNDW